MATNQQQCYEISSKPKQYFDNIGFTGKGEKAKYEKTPKAF